MTLKLPRQKIRDLIQECKKVIIAKTLPICKLASLIGKMSTTANAVFPVRLQLRTLLRNKNYGLKLKGWNGSITLSVESISQLKWWIQNLSLWNEKA
jgi:hypothetical protein